MINYIPFLFFVNFPLCTIFSWVWILFSFVVFHDKCIFGIYQSFCFPMNPGLLQSWITFKVGKVCSTGWKDGRGNKSFFIHSLLWSSLSQAASRHITTRIITSFLPDVLNFAFYNFFQFNVTLFSVYWM